MLLKPQLSNSHSNTDEPVYLESHNANDLKDIKDCIQDFKENSFKKLEENLVSAFDNF